MLQTASVAKRKSGFTPSQPLPLNFPLKGRGAKLKLSKLLKEDGPCNSDQNVDQLLYLKLECQLFCLESMYQML